MADLFVVDTGPVIAWDRMQCLDAIGELPLELVCPREVRAELDAGEICGHGRIAPPWLAVRSASPSRGDLGGIGLDDGERAAIQLALESSATYVVIDEWKGRRAALAVGLAVTGSLGLLAKAKQLGIIPRLRPFVSRAESAGIRYHPAVIAAILEAVGET